MGLKWILSLITFHQLWAAKRKIGQCRWVAIGEPELAGTGGALSHEK